MNPFADNRLNEASDFDSSWDVPSLNDRVSDRLERAIRQAAGKSEPDRSSRIHALLAPPGYGKTHLFGRIAWNVDTEATFVFVPQVEDTRHPDRHLRWSIIQTLFQSSVGRPTGLQTLLARQVQPSLLNHLAWLPATIRAKHLNLQDRLREDPLVALEVMQQVDSLAPHLRLADSAAELFVQCPSDIIRALFLGWSPESNTAKRWLRGDSLADRDYERLNLPEDPPTVTELLQAIAALGNYERPLVLCCDQMEAVLRDSDGAARYTTHLVGLLQSVPALAVIISCLDDRWDEFQRGCESSFGDRVDEHRLGFLTADQAVDLVRLRMQPLTAQRTSEHTDQSPSFPFDEQSLRAWIGNGDLQIRPRALIKQCHDMYEDWLEHRRQAPLTFGDQTEPINTDRDSLFLHEWNQTLQENRQDREKTVANTQEERIHRAVVEAFQLFRNDPSAAQPATIESLEKEGVLKSTASTPRYGLRIRAALGGQTFSTIVSCTKLASAQKFRYYLDELLNAIDAECVGAVIVHSGADVAAGSKTRDKLNDARKKGILRTFSWEDHAHDFELLECFLTLLDAAQSGMLELDGQRLSPDDCRDLTIRSGVLDHLELFSESLAGWTRLPAPDESTTDRNQATTLAAAERATIPPEPTRSVTDPPAPVPAQSVESNVAGAESAVAGPCNQSEENPVAQYMESAAGEPRVSERPVSAEVWANQCLADVVEQLQSLNVSVEAQSVCIGATFARLLVRPLGNTTINKVRNRAEDLKIRLETKTEPIVNSQAGAISIDVELSEPFRRTVTFSETMLTVPASGSGREPLFPVGMDVSGQFEWASFANANTCHFLVAGTTGSGKSEFLKCMIAALARRLTPSELQFILIDPKQVTFNFSGDSPFLQAPVANTVDEALPLLEFCFEETEKRFRKLKLNQVENLDELRAAGIDAPPRLIVICDEFADLMVDKETKQKLEKPLKRLSSKARAAGVHLVLATQRPEASVVTPLIRSNLPGRIAFNVASKADSGLIFNKPDAAALLGRGDMLWEQGGQLHRLQSPLVTRVELEDALLID